MDGHRDKEVAASPLLAAPTQAAGGRRRSHAADVHILCTAFLFVFSAYSAAQNLESTVNTEGDLGTVSLGILYTSFTLFSVVASPVVTRLGPKRALVVGTSGYVLFILANHFPSWYTMVPASLYLGFCASIIWVGQGTYLTSAALSHARDNNLPEGPTLGKFNGEFWGIFASTQVLGNLLSLALLRNGKAMLILMTTALFISCGAFLFLTIVTEKPSTLAAAAGDVEEAAPLLVPDPGARRASASATAASRDVHLLSSAFLFVFLAYHAAQNLQSTVNTDENLGDISLGVLYTSFTAFSAVGSAVVRWIGSRRALVVGTSGYLLFIAANLAPSWYTMVPASLYLGFTASIIWVGQGTYLTLAALSHARENNLPEGPTLGSFNGEFWGMFASTQVIGNLISLALLRNGKDGGSVTGKNLLFAVFLGFMIVGIVLMCLLSKRDEKRNNTPTHSSFGAMLKYIIAPLKDQRMLLTIPLIAYSGLQQAFVWAVFTKSIVTPVLGISGVGGAMAIYGAADVVCSLIAGRLTSGLRSAAFIVSVGAILQAVVLFWLLLFYSPMDGLLGAAIPLFIGALWGVGDGVLNTQLSALLGLLFEDVKEAAFAQLKVWQSGAIAVIFFLSPSIALQAMLILMAAALVISFGSFLFLTIVVEKSSPVIA
ncbi:unnamed protein product [Miscanthus lutarioriparius]|uniref:UNC93-like protein 3 n=1 Tax=Miscanthus lutarioriparius TaxID=422564 RepID=A0A811RIG7_9POAL|nr:unnamed protein product [Miscanthus lutarioriparius]